MDVALGSPAVANRVMRALEACKVHAHFREVFSMDHEPDLHEVRMSKDLRIAYVRYSVMFGSRRIFDKRLGGWCVPSLSLSRRSRWTLDPAGGRTLRERGFRRVGG